MYEKQNPDDCCPTCHYRSKGKFPNNHLLQYLVYSKVHSIGWCWLSWDHSSARETLGTRKTRGGRICDCTYWSTELMIIIYPATRQNTNLKKTFYYGNHVYVLGCAWSVIHQFTSLPYLDTTLRGLCPLEAVGDKKGDNGLTTRGPFHALVVNMFIPSPHRDKLPCRIKHFVCSMNGWVDSSRKKNVQITLME